MPAKNNEGGVVHNPHTHLGMTALVLCGVLLLLFKLKELDFVALLSGPIETTRIEDEMIKKSTTWWCEAEKRWVTVEASGEDKKTVCDEYNLLLLDAKKECPPSDPPAKRMPPVLADPDKQ